jgi:hypothetical protein
MKGILLATAILLTFTTLPYVWCSLQSPGGTEFSGALAYSDAFNSDLGWLRQVQDGHVLLTNIYDHHRPRYAFFNGFWVPLGLLSRASGIDSIPLFHIARWSGFLFLVWIFWSGLRRCVEQTLPRRALLAFFMLGGGFGWMVAGSTWIFLGKPILAYDLMSALYPFNQVLLSAHIPVSHGLVIAAAFLWSRGEETRNVRWFVTAGIVAAFLASFHPYQIPTLWLGLLIYGAGTMLSDRRGIWTALSNRMPQWVWLILIPLPLILYFYWLLHCVAGFASWRSQPPDVPPVWSIPFHLGPLLLLALWSRKHLHEIRKYPLARVCGALFLGNVLIVHSPVAFGWSRQADVPLIGLGLLFLAPAVNAKWQHIRRHGCPLWSKWLVIALFILALGDSPLLLAKRTATAQSRFPFQVPVELLEVFRDLDSRSDFSTVVLSDPDVGPLIPRYVGARSCMGHPQVTSDYDQKVSSYQEVVGEPDDSASRNQFVEKYNIGYWITTPNSDRAAADLPVLFQAGDFRLRLVGEQ